MNASEMAVNPATKDFWSPSQAEYWDCAAQAWREVTTFSTHQEDARQAGIRECEDRASRIRASEALAVVDPDPDAILAEGERRADSFYDRDPDGYQAGQIGSTGSAEADSFILRIERDYAAIARPIGGFDKLEIRSMKPGDAAALLTRSDLGLYEREEAEARARGSSLSRRPDQHGEG